MDGSAVFELAIGAGLLWLIVSFHWLRIGACLVLLITWAAAVFAAPLYLAGSAIAAGELFRAVLTLALAGFLGFFWWIAAKAAYDWTARQDRLGALWLPWHAR